MNQHLKVLNGIKKEQKHKMKDDIKELKKSQGNLARAKDKYEEALKNFETYKIIHEAQ